jgi:hypothetical protein
MEGIHAAIKIYMKRIDVINLMGTSFTARKFPLDRIKKGEYNFSTIHASRGKSLRFAAPRITSKKLLWKINTFSRLPASCI